jgi:ribose transport system permease protein
VQRRGLIPGSVAALRTARFGGGSSGAPVWVGDLAMLPALAALVLLLALTADGFLGVENLTNILSQSSVVAIAAIGATFVIITAGIDLSAGATIGAGGVAAAAVMKATGSVPLGVVVGGATGAAIGVAIGGLVGKLGLVAFVVTLAAMFAVTGATTLITAGETIAPLPLALDDITYTEVLGIPMPAVVAIVLFIVGQWALTRTVWGRKLTLIGANAEAARISGIRVDRMVWSAYLVAGLLSGLAGVVLIGMLAAANASMGSALLLDIIGAVVIGGTSLFGGKGSVLRTAIGVLILGTLANGLSILGFEYYDQQAVKGAVILGAAGIDIAVRRRGA